MSKIIALFFLLFILTASVGATYLYLNKNYDISLTPKTSLPTPTPSSVIVQAPNTTVTLAVTPLLSPVASASITASPTASPSSDVYEAQLQSDMSPDTAQSYFVGSLLVSTLGLNPSQDPKQISDVSKYFDIYFNTTTQKPYTNKLNSTYLLVLKPGTKIDPKTYTSPLSTIKITPSSIGLKYFSQQNNYCQTDNDCTIRTNVCNYGSYNLYQSFAEVYGCTKPQYPYEKPDELIKLCKTNEYPILEYSGSKCVNNACTPQGRTLKSCQAQI